MPTRSDTTRSSTFPIFFGCHKVVVDVPLCPSKINCVHVLVHFCPPKIIVYFRFVLISGQAGFRIEVMH